MVYPDNPSAWEVEPGGSGDWGQLTELNPCCLFLPGKRETEG